MEFGTQFIIAIALYKVASLTVGLLLSYMGYRLFMAGVWGVAGDVEASFKDNKIVFKKAAPGTFFAVLGAAVICFTIYKGLELSASGVNQQGGSDVIPFSQKEELPETPPF